MNYDNKIREYFNKYDEMQEFILKQVSILENPKYLLELGVGTGDFALRVLKKYSNIKVIGLDIDTIMLKKARERLKCFKKRIKLKKADIRDITLYKNIDIVISTLTIHHLIAKEKRALFKIIYQTLCPCGIFILSDIMKSENGNMQMDYYKKIDFPNRVTSIKKWLIDAGFKIINYWKEQDIYVIVSKKC